MSVDKYENVAALAAAFQQFAKADWRKKSMWDGLKPSEVRMLVCVKQNIDKGITGTNVSDISKMLQVTSPTVTQMLNSLIASNYMIRATDQNDRRITEVSLTEKGDLIAQKALERHRTIFKGLIDHLGKEQSDQLIELLSQVFIYLDFAHKNDYQ